MQLPQRMARIRGNLVYMNRRNTPQLVAAAQRLVNSGVSVKAACRQAGISESAFYRNGGRSVPTGAMGYESHGAAREALRQEANAGPHATTSARDAPALGLRETDAGQTIEICGTDTGVEALQFAVTCFAVNSGDADEAILPSGQGMVTLSRRDDGMVSVQFCDWTGETIEVVGRPGEVAGITSAT